MLRFITTERMVFILLFAVLGTVTVIHDPDYYLHLAAGRYFLAHSALPALDPFSFTMEGQSWHIHEWLFELFVASLHAVGGEAVVVWVCSALGVAAYYLSIRSGGVKNAVSPLYLLPVILLMGFYIYFVTQRPQLITFFAFAVYLKLLLDMKYQGETKRLWLLPVVMLVWVNAHGGYMLGLAVIALFLVTEWTIHRREPGRENHRRLKGLAGMFVLTVLVTLINPYFIGHWWFPFALMGNDAMNLISEWQRPDFTEPFFIAYLLAVAIFFFHYLLLRRSPDLTEWLLPVSLVLASFTAGRHVPLAILTLLPFFIRTMGRPLRFTIGFVKNKKAGSELGGKEVYLNTLLLLIVVVLLGVFSEPLKLPQQILREEKIPVAAVDFLERNPATGRLFNQYHYGGYVLHRLYPSQQVFVDGRADLYGADFLRDYLSLYSAGESWERLMVRYEIETVLCEKDAPLVTALLQQGEFQVVHRDRHNVVMQRRIP